MCSTGEHGAKDGTKAAASSSTEDEVALRGEEELIEKKKESGLILRVSCALVKQLDLCALLFSLMQGSYATLW